MTTAELVTIAQVVATAATGVLVWSASRSFAGGRYVARLESRLTSLEERLERAGKLQSDLGDEIQKLDERIVTRVEILRTEMRSEYLPARMADERHAHLRQELAEIHEIIRIRRR